ncbi:MAG: M20/M25/M40 family metallo-hydrolase [Firmicutes bacterium]|nr:M20/M25/M40 family metallo-hydrolase [Bacillota bacterium]
MFVNKERAWEYTKTLSYSRITGSEGEKEACDYFVKEAEALGLKAYHETYNLTDATIDKVGLCVKGGKEYQVWGIPYSGNTPDEGITAPFKFVNTTEEDADLADIKGKIVITLGAGVRDNNLKKMKEKGAVAFIAIHGGLYDDERIHKGPRIRALTESAHVDMPGVSIHMTDAKELITEHAGEELTLVIQQTPKRLKGNYAVAEIPGTEIPEEAVLFSAHCDTVIYALGSWDNGSGCVTLLEAMHYFKQNPPKRTVRFLWCGSEEIGSYGSRTYCETHKEELEKTIFDINIDMLGAPICRNLFCATADDIVLHYTDMYAKIKGWPMKSYAGMYASDSSVLAGYGVPSCSFGQDRPRGGAEIHNYRDDLSQMDPQCLAECIAFVIEYSTGIVNAAVNPIPRKFSEKITKDLERWKGMITSRPLIADEEPKEEKKEEKAE